MVNFEVYNFLNRNHEKIPLLSTATSLFKIYCLSLFSEKNEFFKKRHYTSLNKDCLIRYLILTVPLIGNLVIAIYDYKKNARYQEALKVIKENGYCLKFASKEYKDDFRIVQAALNQDITYVAFASLRIRNHQNFIQEQMKKDPTIYGYSGDALRSSSAFLKMMMRIYGEYLIKYASKALLENKSEILGVLKYFPKCLKYLDQLKEDQDFVLKLAKINSDSLKYISRKLKNDEAFIQALIKLNPCFFKYAGKTIKENQSFVENEAKKQPEILKYSYLYEDVKFYVECVKKDLSFINCLDIKYRLDRNFLRKIPDHQFKILTFAEDELREDLSFNIEAIQKYELMFEDVKETLQSNHEILLEYIKLGKVDVIQKSSKKIQEDVEFAIRCFQIDKNSFQYFSSSVRKSSELTLEVIKDHPENLLSLDPFFRNNISFIFEAIKKNPKVIEYTEFEHTDLFLEEATKINPDILKYTQRGDLRNNKQFFFKVLIHDVTFFKYAGELLSADLAFIRNFILKDDGYIVMNTSDAVRNSEILKFVSDSVMLNESFIRKLMEYEINPFLHANKALRKNLDFHMKYFPRTIFEYTDMKFDFNMLDPQFKDHDEFIFFAAKYNDQIMSFASERLKDCKELALLAIEVRKAKERAVFLEDDNSYYYTQYLMKTEPPIAYFSKRLQDDEDLFVKSCLIEKKAYFYGSERLKRKCQLL